MPANLRLAAVFVVICVVAAVLGIAGVYRQYDHAGRVQAETMTQGSVQAGKDWMARFGCATCHQIPGIKGGRGGVGPSLEGFATRTTIAGRLSNDPANLALWLRHPQAMVPGNGMPDQGIGEQQARDMSAYLYTLR